MLDTVQVLRYFFTVSMFSNQVDIQGVQILISKTEVRLRAEDL